MAEQVVERAALAILLHQPQEPEAAWVWRGQTAAGVMLAFRRNRLVGSYWRFNWANRG